MNNDHYVLAENFVKNGQKFECDTDKKVSFVQKYGLIRLIFFVHILFHKEQF